MKSKKFVSLLGMLVLASMLLAACAPAATPTAAPVEPTEAAVEDAAAPAADLKITGLVEAEQAWAEADVKAMTTMDVEATNSKGETSTYTGVSLDALLALAKPAAGATTIVFVADDGYTVEMPLADALACEQCIVSFRDKGGFSTVMPGFDKSLAVKGVVEIQVK